MGEALYDMKEKLKKTEKKVCEVMKEKERLEKVLEAKLKLIKVCRTMAVRHCSNVYVFFFCFFFFSGFDDNWSEARLC